MRNYNIIKQKQKETFSHINMQMEDIQTIRIYNERILPNKTYSFERFCAIHNINPKVYSPIPKVFVQELLKQLKQIGRVVETKYSNEPPTLMKRSFKFTTIYSKKKNLDTKAIKELKLNRYRNFKVDSEDYEQKGYFLIIHKGGCIIDTTKEQSYLQYYTSIMKKVEKYKNEVGVYNKPDKPSFKTLLERIDLNLEKDIKKNSPLHMLLKGGYFYVLEPTYGEYIDSTKGRNYREQELNNLKRKFQKDLIKNRANILLLSTPNGEPNRTLYLGHNDITRRVKQDKIKKAKDKVINKGKVHDGISKDTVDDYSAIAYLPILKKDRLTILRVLEENELI